MAWTLQTIGALASRRGLTRLTPEHLTCWLVLAETQQDTTAIRDAVARKDIEPAYGPSLGPSALHREK